jgi:hypothetical protein
MCNVGFLFNLFQLEKKSFLIKLFQDFSCYLLFVWDFWVLVCVSWRILILKSLRTMSSKYKEKLNDYKNHTANIAVKFIFYSLGSVEQSQFLYIFYTRRPSIPSHSQFFLSFYLQNQILIIEQFNNLQYKIGFPISHRAASCE